MLELWRIGNHNSLSGEGGLRYGARWHIAGLRIAYLAETPAGALIEILVHLELKETELPRFYNLMKVAAADTLSIESLEIPAGDDWKKFPSITQGLGSQWLRSGRTALARVPSAIIPNTWNYLLNPEHADASLIRIVETMRVEFDSRLLGRPWGS